jgi:hypothetical protein
MGVQGVPLDKTKIIQAIHKKDGVIEHAAKYMGCDPVSIYKWQKEDPDVAQAILKAREEKVRKRAALDEELIDEAYSSAKDLIRERDQALTIFTLKTKAKWEQKEEQIAIPAELSSQYHALMAQFAKLQEESRSLSNKETKSRSKEQKSA